MPTFLVDAIERFAMNLMVAGGVPEAEAGVVVSSLVGANLRGHDSHGVMRIPQYLEFVRDGKVRCGVDLEILSETPALIAADAQWGLGQVQAHRLLGRLIEKARSAGIAAGTLRRCGHTGRLGEYAEAAAAARMAFIGTVNSHGSGTRVAPPGGTEGRISTNPICIGAPTPADPLILDFGTSIAAEGKIRVAFQKDERVPEGWLIDEAGRPTTDPGVLYREPRGSIMPFGGTQAYKGFGLGLLLDALVGGLSGGICSRADAPPAVGNCVLFIVLDIARFGGLDSFLEQTGGLTSFVRSCPTADGVAEILLPGDPERKTLTERSTQGIPIADGTWKLLTDLAARLKVSLPSPR